MKSKSKTMGSHTHLTHCPKVTSSLEERLPLHQEDHTIEEMNTFSKAKGANWRTKSVRSEAVTTMTSSSYDPLTRGRTNSKMRANSKRYCHTSCQTLPIFLSLSLSDNTKLSLCVFLCGFSLQKYLISCKVVASKMIWISWLTGGGKWSTEEKEKKSEENWQAIRTNIY